jgi:glutamate-1-semialdehyde 2,1-aminomutase
MLNRYNLSLVKDRVAGRSRVHGDNHPANAPEGVVNVIESQPSAAVSDSSPLGTAVDRLRVEYVEQNPRSAAEHKRARRFLPGGNTRSTLYYAPFPLVFARGDGASLVSVDGRRYTDFLSEFTAGLYGHSHPLIIKRLHAVLDDGISFGGQNAYEASLAETITARFPSIELIRFTNSGTEANLLALSAATAHTARRTVVVFRGGYHGGVLSFANGASPTNVPHRFHIADYNDTAGTRRALKQAGDDLACVLVEPMLGSGGSIPADPAFLHMLRAETQRRGALLVFDEVMTSRLSSGGLQQVLGVTPDLTTMGKYLGGGMSFGAFGGRADVMSRFDPSQPGAWPHAGTFNNNVLSMAAGLTGLAEIWVEPAISELNARGDDLRDRANAVLRAAGLPLQATGRGSLLTFHAVGGPITSPADLTDAAPLVGELLFLHLVNAGFWLARRGMVALNLAITDTDCDAFLNALDEFIDRYGDRIVSEAGRRSA